MRWLPVIEDMYSRQDEVIQALSCIRNKPKVGFDLTRLTAMKNEAKDKVKKRIYAVSNPIPSSSSHKPINGIASIKIIHGLSK